jgi:hypothetical protein
MEDYLFNGGHLLNSFGYDENHLPWNEVQGFDPNEPNSANDTSIGVNFWSENIME